MTGRVTIICNASWPEARDAVTRSNASASRARWARGRSLVLSAEVGLVLLINGEAAVSWLPHSIDVAAKDWTVVLPGAES